MAWAAGWRTSQLPAPYQAAGFNATLYRRRLTTGGGGGGGAPAGTYTLQLLAGAAVAARVALELADGECIDGAGLG